MKSGPSSKLKNARAYEKGGASRGAKAPNAGKAVGQNPDESSGTIHAKHFGHVIKTTNALHSKDPYCASHKL